MKRAMVLGMMAVGAVVQIKGRETQPVIICMETAANELPLVQAQHGAAKIFAKIGVQLEFHAYHSCSSRAPAIFIDLQSHTSPYLKPGALAYAEPFGGTHIRIFHDRIESTVDSKAVPALLAHVIAHEITHVLERSDGHSDQGIMKRRWDRTDYTKMSQDSLTFSEADIIQIHLSLAAQAGEYRE